MKQSKAISSMVISCIIILVCAAWCFNTTPQINAPIELSPASSPLPMTPSVQTQLTNMTWDGFFTIPSGGTPVTTNWYFPDVHVTVAFINGDNVTPTAQIINISGFGKNIFFNFDVGGNNTHIKNPIIYIRNSVKTPFSNGEITLRATASTTGGIILDSDVVVFDDDIRIPIYTNRTGDTWWLSSGDVVSAQVSLDILDSRRVDVHDKLYIFLDDNNGDYGTNDSYNNMVCVAIVTGMEYINTGCCGCNRCCTHD